MLRHSKLQVEHRHPEGQIGELEEQIQFTSSNDEGYGGVPLECETAEEQLAYYDGHDVTQPHLRLEGQKSVITEIVSTI